RRHRPQGRPSPDPGRLALGRRTGPLLDEWLRQAPPLHREAPPGRRLLPLPRRRPRRPPPAHPARSPPLPLGLAPDLAAPQVAPIVGRSYAQVLRLLLAGPVARTSRSMSAR